MSIPGVEQLWQAILAWWALPVDERIWECGKTAAALLGSWEFLKYLYRWVFRRRSRLEQKIERMEEEATWKDQEIRNLRSEKAELSAESEAAKRKLPAMAIARAEREWRNNNKGRAARELEAWFEENAKSVAEIALHLAMYHISRAVPDPGDHLDQARNLLRLARGASPDSPEIADLSSELDTVNAALQEQLIRDGDAQIAWNSAMAPRPGISAEGLIPAVNALMAIAKYCFSRGLWRLAPIFADRAADVAISGGTALDRLWVLAEANAGNYHLMAGHYSHGLQRLEHVLSVARNALRSDDEILLIARHYRAEGLRRAGRYGEALQEVTALLPVFTGVKGTRHPYVLSLRLQRAEILQALLRNAEALDEIDAMAPTQVEELGARHPDVLTTRYYHALVLGALGRFQEATDEIDSLIPVHAEVKGEYHPDVLATRQLRAQTLKGLGRYEEALDEIGAFINIRAKVIGSQHPDLLLTRSLRAELLAFLNRFEESLHEIDDLLAVVEVVGLPSNDVMNTRIIRVTALSNLGRYTEALHDLDAIIPVLTESFGPDAQSTLSVHMLKAQALCGLRRFDEALEEIDTFGPMHTEVVGESHQDVLVIRMVRAAALKGLGRHDEAQKEAHETMSHLDAITDLTGGLRRSANALFHDEERQPS